MQRPVRKKRKNQLIYYDSSPPAIPTKPTKSRSLLNKSASASESTLKLKCKRKVTSKNCKNNRNKKEAKNDKKKSSKKNNVLPSPQDPVSRSVATNEKNTGPGLVQELLAKERKKREKRYVRF